jgi:hypothetical protein
MLMSELIAHREEQFLSQLAYRDEDGHPFDVNGKMLDLKSDPDYLWSTEPDYPACTGTVWQTTARMRGAY